MRMQWEHTSLKFVSEGLFYAYNTKVGQLLS